MRMRLTLTTIILAAFLWLPGLYGQQQSITDYLAECERKYGSDADLVNGENSVVLPDRWMEKDRVKISALYDRGLEQLKEKMVLTGFGKDPIDIETAVVEHRKIVNAANHIRVERLINIKSCNLILPPF